MVKAGEVLGMVLDKGRSVQSKPQGVGRGIREQRGGRSETGEGSREYSVCVSIFGKRTAFL